MRTLKSTLALASVALASVIGFTSCQDDYDEQNYSVQESKPRLMAPKSFEGNFKSVNFDLQTGQYLTLNIQKDCITLRSMDANGAETAVSKTENMTLGNDGTYTGTLENEVCGIKRFSIHKIGSCFYKLIGQKADGKEVVFGFTEQSKGTLCSASDLISDGAIQALAKKGIKALIDLAPYGSYVSAPIVNQLFPDPPADMKVMDCFNQLNEGIQKIQLEIDKLSIEISKLKDDSYNGVLTKHEATQRKLYTTNTIVMGELASIYEEMQEKGLTKDDDEIRSKIKTAIEDWSKLDIDDSNSFITANEFIYQVAHGYGMNGQSYYHLLDAYAERIFAWEHEGYQRRELYRTRDIITCVQCEILLQMFKEHVAKGYAIHEEEFKTAIKNYEQDKVVRNTEYAICQIPGANHVKIKFNSLERVPENISGRKTMGIPENTRIRYYSTTLIFWHNDKWADLNWFAVPGTNKHWGTSIKGYDTDDIKSHMLTTGEAKAIFAHYGNTKSMGDILDSIACVGKCNQMEKPVLLLGDSKVSMSQDGRSRDFSISLETVCNLSNQSSAFGKYWYGDFTCNWNSQSEWWTFSGWSKTNSTPMYQVYVGERDDKWKPMEY